MSSMSCRKTLLAFGLCIVGGTLLAQPMSSPMRAVKIENLYVADTYESLYNDPSSTNTFEFYALTKTVELSKDDVLSLQVTPLANESLQLRFKTPLFRNLDKEQDILRFINDAEKKRPVLQPMEFSQLEVNASPNDSLLLSNLTVTPAAHDLNAWFDVSLVLSKEGQTRWKALLQRKLPLLSNAHLKLTVNFASESGSVDMVLDVPFIIRSLPAWDIAFDAAKNLDAQGFKRGKIHYWQQFLSCEALSRGQIINGPNLVNFEVPHELTSVEQANYVKFAQDGFIFMQKQAVADCQSSHDEEDATRYWQQYLSSKSISCSNVEILQAWPLVYFDIRLQSELFVKKVNQLYDGFKKDCSTPLDVTQFEQRFDGRGCFTGGILSFTEPVKLGSFADHIELRASAAPSFYAREFTIAMGPLPWQIDIKSTFIPICRRDFDLLAVLRGVESTVGHKLLQDSVSVIEYP